IITKYKTNRSFFNIFFQIKLSFYIITAKIIMKNNFITITKPWCPIYSKNKDFLIAIPIGTRLNFIGVSTKKFSPEKITVSSTKDKIYIYSKNIMQHFKKPFKSIPKIANIRKNIKKIASEFLGMPYAWGGRTPYSENSCYQTSVDCSGFVNLLYRCCGLAIPRNSVELYKFCNKLNSGKELETGDFVFLADTKTKTIKHVLLSLENQKLQESIGSEKPYANRTIDFNNRFGKNKENIKSGDIIGKRIIYFGSVLNDEEKIKQINELFLNCELILANKDNVEIND
ncbi:C40 family peptidase, partial [Candidatus Dependentiae bacterium]|nr:C40 family peptidase [Candidatus Dependentiae bacterium]